jgi:hypothetical protein
LTLTVVRVGLLPVLRVSALVTSHTAGLGAGRVIAGLTLAEGALGLTLAVRAGRRWALTVRPLLRWALTVRPLPRLALTVKPLPRLALTVRTVIRLARAIGRLSGLHLTCLGLAVRARVLTVRFRSGRSGGGARGTVRAVVRGGR